MSASTSAAAPAPRRAPRRRRRRAGFAKHALEAAHDAREVGVVAAALGLHADREEDVGAIVLRMRPGVEVDDLRARGQAVEVEALAPDEHEVGVGGEASRSSAGSAGRARARRRVFGFLSARMRKSSSIRSPGCGERVALDERGEARAEGARRRRRAPRWSPSSTPARPAGVAAAISARATAIADRELDRACPSASAARARPLEDLRQVAPLVADPRAVDRRVLERRDALDARVLAPDRACCSFHSRLRCQTLTVQPRSQPGQTDGVGSRYQTRDLCRNELRQERADRADVDHVVGVRVACRTRRPRRRARASGRRGSRCRATFVFEISRVKRTQREHRMQRSLSSEMRSESVWNLVACTLMSRETDGCAVVLVVVVLQRALAGLVADAAVDRMVERDELQHRLAACAHLVASR